MQAYDTVTPLLEAVRGMLEALAAVAGHDELPDEMTPVFSTMAGQVQTVLTILGRVL